MRVAAPAPATAAPRARRARPCAAAARQLSPAGVARRDASLAEYAALKTELLKNCGVFGAALSGYLALASEDGGVAAGSAAIGAAASVLYLALLCRHVDGLGGGVLGRGGGAAAQRALAAARSGGPASLPALARAGADAYWNALAHPQLLVPVGLAAAVCEYNAGCVEAQRLQPTYLLLGFLSYKAATLDAGWKALKAVTVYAAPDEARPTLPDLPDIDDLEEKAEGDDARLSAVAAVVLSLALSLGGPPPAAAAVDRGCARQCEAECGKLAPGSPDYCKATCAEACDPELRAAPELAELADE